MKIFQKILILCLVLAILAVFVAVCYRIHINENFPKETTSLTFTEGLTDYYKKDPEGFAAYTRKIRVPFEDSKKGKFRADTPIVVPNAGFFQVTLRYNEYILPILQETYKLEETPVLEEGMFTYTLTVSYLTDDPDGLYRVYEPSVVEESTAYGLYTYDKLVFENVDFADAIWVRVDIYYKDAPTEEAYGGIAVFEFSTVYEGERIEMPLRKYRIKKGELPQ